MLFYCYFIVILLAFFNEKASFPIQPLEPECPFYLWPSAEVLHPEVTEDKHALAKIKNTQSELKTHDQEMVVYVLKNPNISYQSKKDYLIKYIVHELQIQKENVSSLNDKKNISSHFLKYFYSHTHKHNIPLWEMYLNALSLIKQLEKNNGSLEDLTYAWYFMDAIEISEILFSHCKILPNPEKLPRNVTCLSPSGKKEVSTIELIVDSVFDILYYPPVEKTYRDKTKKIAQEEKIFDISEDPLVH